MPGGDRTGPMGMGPMTGWGHGFCANPGTRSWGLGRGRGQGGRGRGGFGRGFGQGRGAYPYPATYYPANLSPQEEAGALKAEAQALQEEINVINQRIKNLEADRSTKDKS